MPNSGVCARSRARGASADFLNWQRFGTLFFKTHVISQPSFPQSCDVQTHTAFTLAGLLLRFFFTKVYFPGHTLLLKWLKGRRLVLLLTTCQKEHLQNGQILSHFSVFLPEFDTDPSLQSVVSGFIELKSCLSLRTPHIKPKHSPLALAEALGKVILYFLHKSEA